MRFLLSVFCLVATSAQAYTPPEYQLDQLVYVVPDDTELSTEETLTAAENATHPVVVVFANDVMDDEREDWASETEDAIEDTWEAWSGLDSFAADVTSVILVGLDSREVLILTGSDWDADLELRGGVLSRLTESNFVPQARAGNIDKATALTIAALDKAIVDALAWKAGAPERARIAALEAARREEALARAAEERRLAEAEAARQRELRRRDLHRWLGYASVVMVLGAIFAGLLLLVGARRRKRWEAAQKLDEALNDMLVRLDRAESKVADLRVDSDARDGVLGLRLKGDVTKALLAEVTSSLDWIHVRLSALRSHLTTIEAKARDIGALNGAAMVQLQDELSGAFRWTPPDDDGDLFNPPKPVDVDLASFEAELQARYELARDGWARLTDAVHSSLRQACDDLPADGLHELRGRAQAMGLPESWVRAHPLHGDLTAIYNELDQVRVADPVRYLDALDGIQSHEDELLDQIDHLETLRAELASDRDSLGGWQPPAGVVLEEGQDPREAIAQATDAEAELAQLLQAHGPFDEVVAAGDRARAAWDVATERARRVATAVQFGRQRLESIAARIDALTERRRQEQRELAELSRVHANLAAAMVELDEASEDIRQGEFAVSWAREAMERGAIVTALDRAEEAVNEHEEALTDLAELRTATQALRDARQLAVSVWSTLDEVRAQQMRALSNPKSTVDNRLLKKGDALRTELQREWDSAGDWSSRARRVTAVLSLWRDAVREDNEKYARKLAREAAEAAARAQRYSSSSRSYSSSSSSRSSSSRSSSWGSSRKSRSSYSSSRSSRRSSRSSGSSYSSRKSRSGGSSFSSRKSRSGGSRW